MNSSAVGRCAKCDTELAAGALSCPACNTLVHGEELKQLAAAASELTEQGKLGEARATWYRTLNLLPTGSQQYATIGKRIADLSKRIDSERAAKRDGQAGKRTAPSPADFKFLLLGFTNTNAFVSMLVSLGLYSLMFGYKLAAGLIVGLYIHEMGHVWELRRTGIESYSLLFIPGLGAMVSFKQHFDDPKIHARIGLAGPLWGLGAALAAYGMFRYTGVRVLGEIAEWTAAINLLNLIPVWQLDGARGFESLARWQRWMIVGAVAVAFVATEQRFLIPIGLLAIFRATQKAADEPDNSALSTFVLLIGALAWLSSIHVAR